MHNNTMSYKVISSTSLFTAFLYLTAILAAPIITNSLYKNIHLAQSAKFANKINSTNQAVATTNKVFTTEQPAAVSYIFDDQLVSRQFDNTNLQNYISDAKGSVLKVTEAATGTAENYSYDAYGNIIAKPSSSQKPANPQNNNLLSTIPNSFQYNGERIDSNTTLQYLRARFYNPAIKRFINQDDYALLNKFGYVGANPVMLIDSSGHEAFNPFSSDWWKQTWNSGALGKAESLGIAFGASIALGGIGLLGYKAKNRITSRNTANNSANEISCSKDESRFTLRTQAKIDEIQRGDYTENPDIRMIGKEDFFMFLVAKKSGFTGLESFKTVDFAQSLYHVNDNGSQRTWDQRNGVKEKEFLSLSGDQQEIVATLRSIQWALVECQQNRIRELQMKLTQMVSNITQTGNQRNEIIRIMNIVVKRSNKLSSLQTADGRDNPYKGLAIAVAYQTGILNNENVSVNAISIFQRI